MRYLDVYIKIQTIIIDTFNHDLLVSLWRAKMNRENTIEKAH